jgi:hypothetical protein
VQTQRYRAVIRFPIVFCLGVAATLAWQSYGKIGRELVGNAFPQFDWLTEQAVAKVQSAPEMVAASPASYDSLALEQLKAIALGLAALRQGVDQLTAGQQQMANEMAKLRAAERDILDNMVSPPSSRSPAVPAAKPAPVTPRSPSTPPAR